MENLELKNNELNAIAMHCQLNRHDNFAHIDLYKKLRPLLLKKSKSIYYNSNGHVQYDQIISIGHESIVQSIQTWDCTRCPSYYFWFNKIYGQNLHKSYKKSQSKIKIKVEMVGLRPLHGGNVDSPLDMVILRDSWQSMLVQLKNKERQLLRDLITGRYSDSDLKTGKMRKRQDRLRLKIVKCLNSY